MLHTGFEPVFFPLLAGRLNQLGQRSKVAPRIELGLKESKSFVITTTLYDRVPLPGIEPGPPG